MIIGHTQCTCVFSFYKYPVHLFVRTSPRPTVHIRETMDSTAMGTTRTVQRRVIAALVYYHSCCHHPTPSPRPLCDETLSPTAPSPWSLLHPAPGPSGTQPGGPWRLLCSSPGQECMCSGLAGWWCDLRDSTDTCVLACAETLSYQSDCRLYS